ncbi:replication endonuclease [Arcobacter porcinus]|uniref:Bacteriophage replication protein A (GPA) n=1 Tax=Arcobacter porcinus TaxID=1935204 RepID=A0ABX2YDF5_9BACT|nr:replication endonuclease [Arcobacter porcinus]OCL93025.1 Bacteriophage replication protein A (GPA) [Arcobacter porcinus]
MYGINKSIRETTLKKIQKQKDFLEKFHFDFNRLVDGEIKKVSVPMSNLVKSAIFNQNRYLAEIQERVNSLNNYATLNDLKPLFITITLPTEYHKYRTLKNGKFVKNPKFANKHLLKKLQKENPNLDEDELKKFDEKNFDPNAGAKYLSKVFKKMIDLQILKKIPKEKKCYFRVYEPHQDGTPHLHLNFFVPKEKLEDVYHHLVDYFEKNYNARVDIQKDIKNNTAYLMKYILKTLDDMRQSPELSDLSIWYIHNKITRFYTSRTLIALEVYRKVYNQFSLLELTYKFKNKEINYFVDTETKQVVEITNTYTSLYFKKSTLKDFFEFEKTNEQIKNCRKNFNAKAEYEKSLKRKNEMIPIYLDGVKFYMIDNTLKKQTKPITHYSHLDLLLHYNYLQEHIDTINMNHFYIVKNEMIRRYLLDENIIHLDKYLDIFGFNDLEKSIPKVEPKENYKNIKEEFKKRDIEIKKELKQNGHFGEP